jgi:hypothetical protein
MANFARSQVVESASMAISVGTGSAALDEAAASKWLHLNTPEMIHKAFLEYVPNALGARSSGSGGYRAPTCEERWRLQAELLALAREAKR